MSITINKVNKFYGPQHVLKNISISIKNGEVVGLLGVNGAGKTTLIKIICCYLKSSSGDIKIGNLDIKNNDLLVKKKIGYLSENNPLYSTMYVKEYLSFIAGIYKIKDRKEAINDVIKKVGLTKEKNKKIRELSKGYKQRVGLAAAIIHNPEILILDEPTTGLDPNQLTEIRNLIKNLSIDKTILLSTHIMQEVDKICNRVLILNNGEIVSDKTIDKLKKDQINLEDHFNSLSK